MRWTWSTDRVLRRVRALSPVPGLAIEVAGLKLFVTRLRASAGIPAMLEPGEAAVVGPPPGALVIRTGDGAVQVERAVAEGADEELDGAAIAARVAQRRPKVLDCLPFGGNG